MHSTHFRILIGNIGTATESLCGTALTGLRTISASIFAQLTRTHFNQLVHSWAASSLASLRPSTRTDSLTRWSSFDAVCFHFIAASRSSADNGSDEREREAQDAMGPGNIIRWLPEQMSVGDESQKPVMSDVKGAGRV